MKNSAANAELCVITQYAITRMRFSLANFKLYTPTFSLLLQFYFLILFYCVQNNKFGCNNIRENFDIFNRKLLS